MEQKNENEDKGCGCLVDFVKSVIVILLLLGCWAYYGDWNKAVDKWFTVFPWICGVTAALIVIILLFGFLSNLFNKSKKRNKDEKESLP